MASTPTRSRGSEATKSPARAAATAAPAPSASGAGEELPDDVLAAAPADSLPEAATAGGGAQAAPQAAAPALPQGGLATPDQVVELADQLSACADQIHERVMRELRTYSGKPVPDKVQDAARALLEDEILLRQRANGLYADAATFIVKGLGKPQAHLVKLTTEAAEKIRKIGVIGETVGLVGGLLALAGAAASGQAIPVLLALDKVEKQIKAIEALAPKPPAAKA
ncbi:hypothetical protein [Massilia consociata]|uniref:Uncharacterized protein n=1 Tax=Massilia consociata TaxID=760117 RepID=A0ABV6FGI0_9BURK